MFLEEKNVISLGTTIQYNSVHERWTSRNGLVGSSDQH